MSRWLAEKKEDVDLTKFHQFAKTYFSKDSRQRSGKREPRRGRAALALKAVLQNTISKRLAEGFNAGRKNLMSAQAPAGLAHRKCKWTKTKPFLARSLAHLLAASSLAMVEVDNRRAVALQERNDDSGMVASKSMENLSFGGVAAVYPQAKMPKKYRTPAKGEVSTYRGAGVLPVTRLEDGKARVLLWQPQSGKKKGVRWYDFGGRKKVPEEFASTCACRKFAKETYGLFGCALKLEGDNAPAQLQELYQGLANLPLMLRASEEWAHLQLLDDGARIFYNDIHEYFLYMLCVPYVPEDVLNEVSKIVDNRKRVFRWMTMEELAQEVMAPRLHTASLAEALENLQEDPLVFPSRAYGSAASNVATGSFAAAVVR
eukprot:s2538_g14.t1